MARGNEGQIIYRDDDDRQFFIGKLLDLQRRAKFTIHAFCLMGNHFHLLLEMATAPLSTVMQRLLGSYAKRFNWRHKRSGHLFQDRYLPILCPRDNYFLELVRYIHLNPVRAGLVSDPVEWHWSSHKELLSGRYAIVQGALAMSYFSQDAEIARTEYASFIQAGIGKGVDETLFGEIDSIVTPDDAATALNSIATRLAVGTRVPLGDLRSMRRTPETVSVRRQLILAAFDKGFERGQIASYLGCSPSLISKALAAAGR